MYEKPDVIILNALDKNVHAVAFGNHFTLKPHQIKAFRNELGSFLDSTKGYLGLVALPPEFEDLEFRQSEAGKAILEEKIKEGVNRRCAHLTAVVNNLQHSLRQDMDKADMKADVTTQATQGELNAMDELIGYQRQLADPQKARSEAARVRLRQVQASQSASVNQHKKEE